MLAPQELCQRCPHVRTKLASMVSGDGGWDSKLSNPSAEERECDGVRCDVTHWQSFWPTRETVHTGEEVRMPV